MNAPTENAFQRTGEWFASRIGKLTASNMATAMDRLKSGKSSAKRDGLIMQLAIERLTGLPQGPDLSKVPAVQWGVEQEPYAKQALQTQLGILGKDMGIVDHPSIDKLAASPDWIVDGQPLEIKCPNTTTHFTYWLAKQVPEQYQPQLALQMLCLGATEGTFVSYDSRVPAKYQLFVVPFKPTSEYLALVEQEAVQFLQEVAEMVTKLEEIQNV